MRLLTAISLVGPVLATNIDTYFINKNFDLQTTLPNDSPNIECLVTEGKFAFPKEITMCFRSKPMFYIHFARTGFSWRTVLTFGNMQKNGTKLEEGILFGVYYGGPWVGLKVPGVESIAWLFGGDAMARFPFQVWRHTCVSFNRQTGRMRLVENGVLWNDETTEEVVEAMETVSDTASIFTLGCMYWNRVNHYMAMYGSVTDAQVFSRALETEEMIAITNCSSDLQGDIISWRSADWELRSPYNTTELAVLDLEEDICADTSKSLVLMPVQLTFYEGLHQCKKLSGRLADYRQEAEFDQITHFLAGRGNSFSQHCSSAWGEEGGRNVEVFLAVSDEKRETDWRTWEGDRQVEHLPWAPNRPTKNGEANNCMLLKAAVHDSGGPVMELDNQETDVIDESCFSYLCPLCVVEAPSMVFQLRGLCPETVFSTTYTFYLTDQGQVRYLGDQTSLIFYNKTTLSWVLYDRRDSSAKAVSKALETSLLIGRHTFDFGGVPNDICTSNSASKELRVKMTSCQEGQFTCSDGQCVTMKQRCDQIVQCRDESDEDDCRLLSLKTSYNQKVPPIVTVNTTTFRPVPVYITIVMLKIVSLEEIENKVEFQFTCVLNWKENRAQFNNLKKDTALNALTDEEITALWLPMVIYDNTDQKETTRRAAKQADAQWATTITVSMEGNFTRSGPEQADEVEVFEGKENTLTMNQTYSKKFQCLYKLQRYPFDTQECSIEMIVGALDLKTVQLLADKLEMKARIELTQYRMTKWTLEATETGVRMIIIFKRMVTAEMLTTYMPSLLLILTTYATTFFKPFYFEAAVTVNLTTMLVMTTIFTSVMDKLPPTAYVKMIDIWLIGGQLIPFIEVVLLTVIECLREGDGSGQMTLNHHGQERIVMVDPATPSSSPEHKMNGEKKAWKDSQVSPEDTRKSPDLEDPRFPMIKEAKTGMSTIQKFMLLEAIIIPSVVAALSAFYIFVCILFFYEVA